MLGHVMHLSDAREREPGSVKRRMVFCLCADLTGSGEWLASIPSFESQQFNEFFAQLLETYHGPLGVSRRGKYEGDAWLVATDNEEEVIALCFLALDLRRTFRARTAELLGIAAEVVPPLHLTICSGADVPVAAMSGHDWAGDSFRRAVRMASKSSEGAILIDTPVYYMVRQDFVTRYLTTASVKSKRRVVEETIALYELFDLQDSMKAAQEVPGIYIRGLRVLGQADVADELAQRSLAHLRTRTLGTPLPDRGSLLPTWNSLLASAADYSTLLLGFEALVETKLEPDAATYSLLVDRAPDASTQAHWRNLMEKGAGCTDAPANNRTAPGAYLGAPPPGSVFQETAETSIAPRESAAAVSVMIHTSHGHGARGAGVILSRCPLLIMTVSHVVAGIQMGTKVSLSIDGVAHRLLRVIRIPGPQAGLFSVLMCRGRSPSGKRSVELPQTAIDLERGQPVVLELQRGGAFAVISAEVVGTTGTADGGAVLLSTDIGEGDSGAPVLVNGRLAGVCQAKSGLGATGAAVITPIAQDTLTRLIGIVRCLCARRRAVRVGLALCLVGALSILGLLVGRQPPHGCGPRPSVTAWLDEGATYYDVGAPIVLRYRINKQCNVSLAEQVEGAAPVKLLDKLLQASGEHEFRATASTPAGARSLRMTATDACGATAESVVAFHVGSLVLDPDGPSGLEPATAVRLATFADETAARLPNILDFSVTAEFADFDADGDLDVYVANTNDTLDRLLFNDGRGGFQDETASHLPSMNELSGDVAVGDLDGDGDVDIFLGNGGGNNVQSRLLLNSGDGHFRDATAAGLPALVDSTTAVRLADFDRDGDLDAFIANWLPEGQQSRLLTNDGHGRFVDVTSRSLPTLVEPTSGAAVGDVDLDGDLDIILANGAEKGGQRDRILINDGSGHFSDESLRRLPDTAQDASAVIIGDVDGDGAPDLLFARRVYYWGPAQNTLFLNDGRGYFRDATVRLPQHKDVSFRAAFADVDSDGDLDIFVANIGGDSRLLLNDGSGRFTDSTGTSLPPTGQASLGVAFGDVDGDGDPDLLVLNAAGSGPQYEQNRLLINTTGE
jgi:hypothetical protein